MRNRPSSFRLAVGLHSIHEALRVRPREIQKLIFRSDWSSSSELTQIHEIAKKKNIKIELRPTGALDKISSGHQGIAAEIEPLPEFDVQELESKERSIVLALDGLEDPHNLGAITRTGWLMGVSGLLIPSDRAVGLTPTVHKVACGGVEHVPLRFVQQFGPVLSDLKEMGFWVFGLSHKATKSIYDLRIPEKVVWCIGSEDRGLRVTTERACDELVSIPQSSKEASYNASVACGMTLSETVRQHLYLKK